MVTERKLRKTMRRKEFWIQRGLGSEAEERTALFLESVHGNIYCSYLTASGTPVELEFNSGFPSLGEGKNSAH